MLLPAPAASAHAFLTSSTPSDGQTLTSAPSEIRLQFSESVVLGAVSIDIADGHGHHTRPISVRIQHGEDTEASAEIIAAIPVLAQDAYRMTWETLSSDDLHRTNGLLVFGIGESVTAAGTMEPTPPPDEVLLRAGLFLAMAVSLGGLLAAWLARRAPVMGGKVDLGRRSAIGSAWGSAAALLFCPALLADQVLQQGAPAAEILVSSYGLHSLLREVGFAVLLLVGLRSRARSWRSALIAMTVPGMVTIGVDTALMGHSGSGLTASTTRVVADAVHLLAAATWSGALLVMIAVVLPVARREGSAAVHAMLRSFGIPAAVCVGVMIVTGVYLASAVVGSVDALISTFYGRALLVKLAVVLSICALGVVNHRRLRRQRDGVVSGRTIAVEGAAAAVVLALAAVLTSSQPALETQYITVPGPSVVPVQDAAAGDLQETVAIRTNVPGRNVVLATVSDTRRPSPAPIRSVLITLIDPAGHAGVAMPADNAGEGRWSITSDIPWASPFSVRITVQRPGMPDVVASYPWVLAAAGAPSPAVISKEPLGGFLRDASALLLVLLVVSGGTLAWRRSRVRNRIGDSTAGLGQPCPGDSALGSRSEVDIIANDLVTTDSR